MKMIMEEQSPILVSLSTKGCTGNMDDSTENKKFHNYWLSTLCALFGIGTWLPVNAIYSQLPIFVQVAPEGWSLPSYFSLSVQVVNVIPLTYYLFHKKLIKYQSILICSFLMVGSASVFSLAFTYDITLRVFDEIHSVFFFLFSIALASVGCLSSVLFLPFMNKLPELYLVPYFIGEGLSGLIPSMIALVQGVGKEAKCVNVTKGHNVIGTEEQYQAPIFSSTIFLMIIGGIMLLSTGSFFYLNYFTTYVKSSSTKTEYKTYNTKNSTERAELPTISKELFILLLLLQTSINCFSNGILPGIQSYSCLPYGTGAYYWSVNLNQIISPLVMYLAFFLPLLSLRLLNVCCLLTVVCLGYELVTAFTSPMPPLVGTGAGITLIVLVWMIGSGLISYMKLSIATIFRRRYQKAGLINYGLVTQIGSALGSVLSFVLINVLKLLQPVPKQDCSHS